MNYPEALFFVGRCLTLGEYPERVEAVRREIQNGKINWEAVVWVSTGQFVFPALHLQLERARLLPYLPAELVGYMQDITERNRERNKKIVTEAFEISALLMSHGITPVFLKGTAHLLDRLYTDIAERMIGDIDLLVSDHEMEITAEVLISKGYQPMTPYHVQKRSETKHYPRLIHPRRMAAVEIHRRILRFADDKVFENNVLICERKELNEPASACVLSDKYQIIHNILNVQINDRGYFYAGTFVRQAYDLLLLSRRKNPLNVIIDFGKFFTPMNANLAWCNKIFDDPASIPYKPTWKSACFLKRAQRNIRNTRWSRFVNVLLHIAITFTIDLKLLYEAVWFKPSRDHFLSRLRDPGWIKRRFLIYAGR